MKLRSDFRKATTIMNRLHRESEEEEERLEPIIFTSIPEVALFFFQSFMVAVEWKLVELIIFWIVAVRSFTADNNLLEPTVGVNRVPSHVIFSCFTAQSSMSPMTLVQGVFRTSSMCHALEWLFWFSSTLHSALYTVFLIIFFILLIVILTFIFIFHVVFGSMRSTMRTSANEEVGTLAQNNPLTGYNPNVIDNYNTSETTEMFIQDSAPATAGRQTCMTWRSMTTPLAERSLHHCSLTSEKIQRAVDKPITLLTKLLQVSRSLSVM